MADEGLPASCVKTVHRDQKTKQTKKKHRISFSLRKKKKPGKASGAICLTRAHAAVPPTDPFDTKLSHVNAGPRGEKPTVSQAIQNFSVSNVTLKTVEAPQSERRQTARRYCARWERALG